MHSSFQIPESEHQHQHLFLNPPQFAPPLHHHHDAAAPSSSFLPLNFKLGLNEICRGETASFHEIISSKSIQCKYRHTRNGPEGTSVWMAKVEHSTASWKKSTKTSPSQKPTKHVLATSRPPRLPPEKKRQPRGETVRERGERRRRRGRKLFQSRILFEHLVSKMMRHQENLQARFSERIEKMDEERREREEAWRSQELARFEVEDEARAREKDMAEGREATIFSYLEKITGQKFSRPSVFCPSETTSIDASNDFRGGWK